MITEVKINNFKSVADLTLPLGRFNVLIGSNGAGKSNILEAIAFGAAASADKLDIEFLGSRGIRTASAQLMKSAFTGNNLSNPIYLNIKKNEKEIEINIQEEVGPIPKWIIIEKEKIEEIVSFIVDSVKVGRVIDANSFNKLDEWLQKTLLNILNVSQKEPSEAYLKGIKSGLESFLGLSFKNRSLPNLDNFLIYSPEISSLRKFEEEGQIQPLGIKGEGLFNVLQIFYENYPPEIIEEIRQYLHVIEWFDDFEAIFDRVSGRKSLVVKDRNLPDVSLNQHNVNEGFLFLLFYISLMVSKETPAFFAIDNIEASFHPALCEELIKRLVELSKKYDKQVILTTHNPFVLDGLDLNDPEQKLFVVRRNGDGETVTDAIKPIKNSKLSEAWMRGRIGGQPETIN